MTPDESRPVGEGNPSMKFYDKNMNEITGQQKISEFLSTEFHPKRDQEIHYGNHVHWAHSNPQIQEPPTLPKLEGTFERRNLGLGEWVEHEDQ